MTKTKDENHSLLAYALVIICSYRSENIHRTSQFYKSEEDKNAHTCTEHLHTNNWTLEFYKCEIINEQHRKGLALLHSNILPVKTWKHLFGCCFFVECFQIPHQALYATRIMAIRSTRVTNNNTHAHLH